MGATEKISGLGGAGAVPLSSVRGCLGPNDPRWAHHCVVEIASASIDSQLLGVGGSPWLGDTAQTGVTVPVAATPDQSHRYLIRLCGVQIPSGKSIVIRGLRQLVTLRALLPSRLPLPNPAILPLDLEQTSPLWHFTDANISWHLRKQGHIFSRVFDAAQTPGFSPGLRGIDTSILYEPPLLPTYTPPSSGIPPGTDVWGLGTFRDLRFPWNEPHWTLATPVGGPALVVFYASVHQSNAGTRQPTSTDPTLSVLRPEDQFIRGTSISGVENAIYGKVAGAMTVEIFPHRQAPGEW